MEKNKKNDNLSKQKSNSKSVKEQKVKKTPTKKKVASKKGTVSKKTTTSKPSKSVKDVKKVKVEKKEKTEPVKTNHSKKEESKATLIVCLGIILIIVILAYFLMQDSAITGDEAKDIAMQDLSQITTSAVFNNIEYEKDNDVVIYIVEFSDATYKYTYKVNSKTKEIINFVKKRFNTK